jgi:hypothetical protein
MSETGPVAAVAHVRSKDLTGDPYQEVGFRVKVGQGGPLVDLRRMNNVSSCSLSNDIPARMANWELNLGSCRELRIGPEQKIL